MDMPAHAAFFFSLPFQFPSAKKELECRALQVVDENVKKLKKNPTVLFRGHKNNVVCWI